MFRAGLIIIIIGWIICLNIYWVIFGIPIFIVGLITVWFSKTKIKAKLATTLIPLLLWYPGLIAFMYLASSHMTPQTFLIPLNFRGQITLIYNEPCGQRIQKINGRMVYKIPDNGVMILVNKLETGIIDQEYYFVDSKGNKLEKLKMLIQQDFNEDYTLEKNKKEPPRNKVGVLLLGTGGGSTQKNQNYTFDLLGVNSWDSFRVMNNSFLTDKLVDSLLYDCRHKK